MSAETKTYFQTFVLAKKSGEKDYEKSFLEHKDGTITLYRLPFKVAKLSVSDVVFTNEISHLTLKDGNLSVTLQTEEFCDRMYIWYNLKRALYDSKKDLGLSTAAEGFDFHRNTLSECGNFIKTFLQEHEFKDFNSKPSDFAHFYSTVEKLLHVFLDRDFRRELYHYLDGIGFSRRMLNFFIYLTKEVSTNPTNRVPLNTTIYYIKRILWVVSNDESTVRTIVKSNVLKKIIDEIKFIHRKKKSDQELCANEEFICLTGILHNCSKIPQGRQQIRNFLSFKEFLPYLKSEAIRIRLKFFFLFTNIIDSREINILATDEQFLEHLLQLIAMSLRDNNLEIRIQIESEHYQVYELYELIVCVEVMTREPNNRDVILNKEPLSLFVKILRTNCNKSKKQCLSVITNITYLDEFKLYLMKNSELMDEIKNQFNKEEQLVDTALSTCLHIINEDKDQLMKLIDDAIARRNIMHFKSLMKIIGTPSCSEVLKYLKISAIKDFPEMTAYFLSLNPTIKLWSDPTVCKNMELRTKITHNLQENPVDEEILNENVSPFWISVVLGRVDVVKIYVLDNIDDTEMQLCIEESYKYPEIDEILTREICKHINKIEGQNIQIQRLVPVYLHKTKERRILAYSNEVSAPHSIAMFGLAVEFRNPKFPDLEAIKVLKSDIYKQSDFLESELSLIKDIIEFNGDDLFKSHSNLNMISGCPIKSKDGELIRDTCIVLYCHSKGYIPFKEKQFPQILYRGDKHLPVDVREGFFQLGHGRSTLEFNNPLRMGCSVGNTDEQCGGTLGPFVEIGENKIGFLTYSHVILPSLPLTKSLEKQPVIPGKQITVVQPANDTFDSCIPKEQRQCGHVLRYSFDMKSSTGIDAAVVQITDRDPEKGYFVINKPSEILKNMDTRTQIHQNPFRKRKNMFTNGNNNVGKRRKSDNFNSHNGENKNSDSEPQASSSTAQQNR